MWQSFGMESYFKQYVVTANTVAYFKLNGNGDDLSSNNWQYSATTGTTGSWVSGFFSTCLKNTGTTTGNIIQYTSKMVIPAGAKTISLWFKQNTPAGDYKIIITNTYPFDGGIASGTTVMQMANGRLDVEINGGSTRQIYIVGNTNYIDSLWHNYCYTWDGTTTTNGVKTYVDGLLVKQQTSSWTNEPNNATYNFAIGPASGGINSYQGWLDEVIIEKIVWSADVVSSYYSNYYPHGTP